MKVYFKPPICCKNSKRGTTYFFKIYISLTSRGLILYLREVSEGHPRDLRGPPRDLEGHPIDLEGHNFITEFLTFYLLSHPFVVKTAKRARLTFFKIYISLTSRETCEGHPIDLEGQGTTYFLKISLTSRETYRLTWKVIDLRSYSKTYFVLKT